VKFCESDLKSYSHFNREMKYRQYYLIGFLKCGPG